MARKYLKYISLYYKKYRFKHFLNYILLSIYSISDIFFPYVLSLIIDIAIEGGNINFLIKYTIVLIICMFVMIISNYLSSNGFVNIANKIIMDYKKDILVNLSNYSEDYFLKNDANEILSILENDLYKVELFYGNTISSLIINIIIIIGMLIIVFQLNKIIFSSSLIIILTYSIIQTKYGDIIKESSTELSYILGDLYKTSQEILSNIVSINLLNSFGMFFNNYNQINKKYFDKTLDISKDRNISISLGIFFQTLGIVLVISYGGLMVIKNKMSFGVMFALNLYVQKLYQPILSMSNLYLDIKSSMASFQRVYKLLETDQKYVIKDGYLKPVNKTIDSIEFSNISYGYNNKILVKDFNLKMSNGDFIGFVGSNGSGKSTLMKILLRNHEQFTGDVFVNNLNLKDYKLCFLRKKILLLEQRPFIFNGTILDNILLTNDIKITEEELNKILKLVCLDKDIKNMENGINTYVGKEGKTLSGGQLQKISLARAFVRKPDVLILDEPTSSLDIQSEKIISENLKRYFDNDIVIVITHREEILDVCNKIIKIENYNIIKL